MTCLSALVTGLFSPVDGIAPQVVEPMVVDGLKDLHDKILAVPSLISVLKAFGIATYPAAELIALLGAVVALFCFISTRFCVSLTFGFMWVAYYSLVGITGTFHSQCDDLLLEAGAIAFLLTSGISSQLSNVSDNLYWIYMRYVLFR